MYLLLPELRIQNANALSSSLTIGFPAMTAWLGAVHALQRKINQSGFDGVRFKQVGIVCHDFDLRTYRGSGDYVSSIIGTGNPLTRNGERPSFIEEARCHLTVSLLIDCDGVELCKVDDFIEKLSLKIHSGIKFASGDLIDAGKPQLLSADSEYEHKKHLCALMPGYALVERRELMIEAMNQGKDALDALLDHVALYHDCEQSESEKVEWTVKRKTSGWIVPIATGFQGLTKVANPDETSNQRDPSVPHCFAEAVITLGEFIMPYRFKSLKELFWGYEFNEAKQMYICVQNNSVEN